MLAMISPIFSETNCMSKPSLRVLWFSYECVVRLSLALALALRRGLRPCPCGCITGRCKGPFRSERLSLSLSLCLARTERCLGAETRAMSWCRDSGRPSLFLCLARSLPRSLSASSRSELSDASLSRPHQALSPSLARSELKNKLGHF